jgi:hypothetical protein
MVDSAKRATATASTGTGERIADASV